jgi:hypothetical protein
LSNGVSLKILLPLEDIPEFEPGGTLQQLVDEDPKAPKPTFIPESPGSTAVNCSPRWVPMTCEPLDPPIMVKPPITPISCVGELSLLAECNANVGEELLLLLEDPIAPIPE